MAVAIAMACYLAIKNLFLDFILLFHKYQFNFKTSTCFEFGGNEIIP